MPKIADDALDILFRDARSQNGWLPREVSEETLQELHDVMKWGPTSANCWPQRVVFAVSDEAKERLASIAMPGNQDKIRQAPATAILGYDLAFFEKMDVLFAHNPGMAEMFRGDSELAEVTAFRNATLQGAYFMIAARSVGLDCGHAKCDELFFAGTSVRSNFLCSIGYGDPEGLFPRLPRPEFAEVCRVE
ncbi:MAG: malonic semialdehyde reductase [Acidobacteria bacterium]|nr:malonic semialdehyde reductase [Acidobacteriota bacterium]